MSVKLLTEHHLEFLSLKGGYTTSSESTLVEMTHCWRSHVANHFSSRGCFPTLVTYALFHPGETYKLTYCDERKKMTLKSQTVRAKITPS